MSSWSLHKIGNVLDVKRGGSPRPIKKYITDDPNGLNWIKIGDATASGKYIYKTKQKITKDGLHKTRLVEEGDFLLSNSMSFGRPYIMGTKGCIHDGWLVLRDKKEVPIDTDYLYHLLGSPYMFQQFDKLAAGSTVRNLNISLVSSVEIPIPPLSEQKQIVEILDEAFEAIDQAKANIEKNIQNAEDLFQSKLNEVFSQKGEGWEEKTLLDLCDHKSQIVGGPFGSNLKVKDYKETGVPILRIQNIGKGYFIDKNMKFVSDEKAEELNYHSFVSGDIVLAKLGIPIGKTCVVPENYNYGILTADVVRIRPNIEIVDYSFLKHFLNSQNAVKQLTDDITGATRPRVNMPEVRNLKLSVPSKEEQITLNKIIDGLESDINGVISNYEKKNLDLDELKKSILQKAFSGELTANEEIVV